MATLNKAAFEAKYGSSGTIFPDNTTGDISEGDMRDFGQDIADSLYNVSVSGALTFKVIEIGDWDMDDVGAIYVAHGVSDHTKIRTIYTMIRSDSDADFNYSQLDRNGSSVINDIDVTSIRLTRTPAGIFDSVDYDAVSYNRGWITIAHVS
jgi:hypothetical protein